MSIETRDMQSGQKIHLPFKLDVLANIYFPYKQATAINFTKKVWGLNMPFLPVLWAIRAA